MSSKAKAKKQPKKGMSPRAKENLALGFKSILSNACCVELGRSRPWYAAIIMFLLSAVISLIPSFTAYMTVSGGALIGTPTYNYENGLYHLQKDAGNTELAHYLSESNFAVSEDGALAMTRNDWTAFTQAYNASIGEKATGVNNWNWYRHWNEDTGSIDFQVFFAEMTGSEFTEYAKAISNAAGVSNASLPNYESVEGAQIQGVTIYKVNTLILGKNQFRVMKYNSHATLVAGGYGVELNYSGTHFPVFSNAIPTDRTASDYTTQFNTYWTNNLKTWTDYADVAYRNYKNFVAWSQTGIMAAIFVGFAFLMGVLVFVLTRGKNNPYRIINFWQAQKIVYWAMFTPAILQLILGFIMGSSSIMAYAFVFLLGIRVMWLSMRTLSPNNVR